MEWQTTGPGSGPAGAMRAGAVWLLSGLLVSSSPMRASAPPRAAFLQLSEKDSRTRAQRKINSQLLYEVYRARGQAAQRGVPPGPTGVKLDRQQRALVDVRAEVTEGIRRSLDSLGATIVSTSSEHRSTIAWVPLLKLEELAELEAVRAIEPAAEATTAR